MGTVKYYSTGTCVECGKGRIIAPWGDEPRCFGCHGYYITRVEHDTKTVHYTRPTCQECGDQKDAEGLCRCNYQAAEFMDMDPCQCGCHTSHPEKPAILEGEFCCDCWVF